MTTTVSGPALSGQLDAELLEDKLRIPQPGLAVLPRSRVAELIEAAMARRVTLMTGPPGAGKTVAAAQWAAARAASRRPAWVSLDAGDAEPGRFWRYVSAALATAGAIAGSRVAEAAGLTSAEIPNWLNAAVRTTAGPVVLVLDDVQVLADSEALDGLDELIRHEPAGLRLLLAGRSAPGLGLARLRLAGDLADIGAADLACTPEETAAYFGMLGQPLSTAERDRVQQRTEGWLAGLRLTALEAADGGLVAEYLQDELLSKLPAEVRSLMLRTCLTRTVPADLARELSGDAGAARVLDQLSRENGLVQAVPSAADEYRYHPMLRDVLAADLKRELPEEVPVLHSRVARWHAAKGEVLPAVLVAAEAGDWEFGVRLLREAGPTVLLSRAGPDLEAALATVPRERVAAEPVLAMALAAGRLWQGDADGALPHLETAELGLQQRAEESSESESGSDEPARPGDGQAELWLTALGVLHKATVSPARPGWLDREWALASRAHADPRGTPEHRAVGVLWLALGFAALRELDTQLARSALLHAGSQLSAGGLLALRDRGRAWEALACALYGDLAAASRLAASVADGPNGDDEDLAPVLALAGAAVSLARDEPDAAGALLGRADLSSMVQRPAGEPSIAVLSGLLRARLAIADGNLVGARGLVRWLTDAAAGAVQAGYGSGRESSAEARAPSGTQSVADTPTAADLRPDGSAAATRRDGALRPGAYSVVGDRMRPFGIAAVIKALDAEISLAAGEQERARATLTELTAPDSGLPRGLPRADLNAEFGAGRTAAPSAAPSAAQPEIRPEAVVCQARLLIADSDDKGALNLVAPLLADTAGVCSVSDRIAALLTAVIARRRLGQASEAAELLSQALALAEPEEACGPFVSAGPPLRSALTVLISPSSRCAGFAGRILERFDGRLPRPPSSQAAALLTESELSVLRFLPSHMTNQEIAEALFLSINTIKTHLSSVYRKLGVANRRQAIAQGRRLELL